MIILSLLVILVLYLLVTYWKNTKIGNELSKSFNSVPYKPFLGNLHLFPRGIPEIFELLMSFSKSYGKNVITRGILSKPALQVSESKLVEKVLLLKRIEKSIIYDFMKPWLGTGLLTAVGPKWSQRRKTITPAFHFKVLAQSIDVFNIQANKMVEKLRLHSGKERFNIYDYVTLTALDIICETAMGVSINAQENAETEYIQAVKQMNVVFFKRLFNALRDFPILFYFQKIYWEQRGLLKILHKFTDEVIEKRRQQLAAEKLNEKETLASNPEDVSVKRKLTLLDLLLDVKIEGEPLKNSDIREEVDTFMFAGHDTVTSGISFAIYHLSMNPSVQDNLYAEIVDVLGNDAKNAELSYGILQEMKYLDMTIKETLRIHSPVPIIGRNIAEDTIIDGVMIPAGVDVDIPIYAMHRDETIFPNPTKFDPERFNDENSQKRGPYDYIPFSSGPRNCIGQKYAILEMKTILVKLITNYVIVRGEYADEIKCKTDLVLRPVDGIYIKIQERV